MKQLLVILVLCVSILFISGCSDDESLQNPSLSACQVVLNLFASFDATNPVPIEADPSSLTFVSGNCPFLINGNDEAETLATLAPLALLVDGFPFPAVVIAQTSPTTFSAEFEGVLEPSTHPLCNLTAASSNGEFTITSPTSADLDADIVYELSGLDGNVNNCVGVL